MIEVSTPLAGNLCGITLSQDTMYLLELRMGVDGKYSVRDQQEQEILVPDWLITSHVT